MATYADQLTQVQAAIAKAELGQEVQIAGRVLKRGDLAVLYTRERYLRTMAAREAAGNVLSVSAATRGS